jgi:MFS family permease
MNDLLIAYAVMFLLSLIAGCLAGGWFYPRRGQGGILLVTLAVVGMFAYLFYMAGQLFLARIVPASAAIVWTNLTPVLAALAAGWILRLGEIPRTRRLIMSLIVTAGALGSLSWPSLGPLLRPPPPGDPVVHEVIALQSSWATCSPAAAATLLVHAGIPVSEQTMIPLCLTDSSGTPSLGLYRGLKLMAAAHDRDVELLRRDVDELFDQPTWPLLLTVQLPRYGVDDPRYEQQWGWIPGMGHSVVVLRRLSETELLVADPAAGLEVWTRRDLEVLFHGGALRLKPAAETARNAPGLLGALPVPRHGGEPSGRNLARAQEEGRLRGETGR